MVFSVSLLSERPRYDKGGWRLTKALRTAVIAWSPALFPSNFRKRRLQSDLSVNSERWGFALNGHLKYAPGASCAAKTCQAKPKTSFEMTHSQTLFVGAIEERARFSGIVRLGLALLLSACNEDCARRSRKAPVSENIRERTLFLPLFVMNRASPAAPCTPMRFRLRSSLQMVPTLVSSTPSKASQAFPSRPESTSSTFRKRVLYHVKGSVVVQRQELNIDT